MKKYEMKFRTILDGLAVLSRLFDTHGHLVEDFQLHWVDLTLHVADEKEGEFQNIITIMFNSGDYGILSCVRMDLLEE